MKKSSKRSKKRSDLKAFLEEQVSIYNQTGFIADDPISLPHRYSLKQDIEIVAFWTSILAWGQRKTIINKSTELFALMGDSPYDFILNHTEKDRSRFSLFKHRTFQYTDTLYFLEFLQYHYRQKDSLEDAFLYPGYSTQDFETKSALSYFHEYFFSLDHAPDRTRKHIASPTRNSTCKRLNMYLRWMVRKDKNGVDFGIWSRIPMSALMVPLDVHVHRVAIKLGLVDRKQSDWKTVDLIMDTLRMFDAIDPAKYDYALFGLGVNSEPI